MHARAGGRRCRFAIRSPRLCIQHCASHAGRAHTGAPTSALASRPRPPSALPRLPSVHKHTTLRTHLHPSDPLASHPLLTKTPQPHHTPPTKNPSTSSSSAHVSAGLAIHAVAHARRALKSLLPALRNWSPTCRVRAAATPPKWRWQARTPHDLSPMSTKTSLPPVEGRD